MTGLRGKLAILFVIGFGLMSALTLTYLHQSLQRSFLSIEQKLAIEQVRQVGRNLDAELADLSQATYDWSNWDDAYTYLQNPTKDFSNRHASPAALKGIGVKFFALLDNQHNPVFSEAIDLKTAEIENGSSRRM